MEVNRLTPERIQAAYDKTGYRPVYGLFYASRDGEQEYACPLCAVIKAEFGRILGPRGKSILDHDTDGVGYAALRLGLSEDYLSSFMTAYDGLSYEFFTSTDPQGIKDGEEIRRLIPPDWGK